MPEALNGLYGPLPEWMKPYLNSAAMQRLKHIDMNCGMNYTSFPLFQNLKPYSRFIHSVHTAQIMARFTDDRRQILAALFHDIATPAFSHTVDFAKGDYIRQEATEDRTSVLIERDETLSALLKKEGIAIHEVDDYHMYPLADNESPRLSADRLEYTLGNSYNYGFSSLTYLCRIYDDLICGTGESGEEELIFASRKEAEDFALLSIRCGRIYACREDRYGMEILARILKKAMRKGIISESDLYQDEPYVIRLLKGSFLKEKWENFTCLHKVYAVSEDTDAIQIHTKKRYVDPIAASSGRVHLWSRTYRNTLKEYLNESQEERLKGE